MGKNLLITKPPTNQPTNHSISKSAKTVFPKLYSFGYSLYHYFLNNLPELDSLLKLMVYFHLVLNNNDV